MASGNGLSRQDGTKEGYIEEVEDDGETDLSGTEESVANGKSTGQVKEEDPPRVIAAGSTFWRGRAIFIISLLLVCAACQIGTLSRY
jgi:hypothetical protein